MSLWTCSTHGLTGPAACCSKSVRCTNTGESAVTDAPRQDAPDAQPMQWRKKPVVITAIRYTGDNLLNVLAFTGKSPRFSEWFANDAEYVAHVEADRRAFKIFTLEGVMEAMPGDYVIRGVRGEHYPCKPDIFAEIHEPADGLRERVPSEPINACPDSCECDGSCEPPALAPHAPEPVAAVNAMLVQGRMHAKDCAMVKHPWTHDEFPKDCSCGQAHSLPAPETFTEAEWEGLVWSLQSRAAFLAARYGAAVHLVGSALNWREKPPNDIDIRIVLPDAEWEARFGGNSLHFNAECPPAYVAEVGKMTRQLVRDLRRNIDLQVQPENWLDRHKAHDKPRLLLADCPATPPSAPEPVAWMIQHRDEEKRWKPMLIPGAMDPREVHNMGERFEYTPLYRATPPQRAGVTEDRILADAVRRVIGHAFEHPDEFDDAELVMQTEHSTIGIGLKLGELRKALAAARGGET